MPDNFSSLHRVDSDGYTLVRVTSGNSDGSTTGTITSVSGAAASTQLLASTTSRKGGTVFNDSTAILYLALADTTASTSVFTVKMEGGSYYELPATEGGVYTGKIVGIWASATGAARITEFT